MMTDEVKTMFHSEAMGVFNSPLAASIKYDGKNRPTQPLWGVRETSAN